MDGIQPEVLVVLLYLSLIYEIITGVRIRGQQLGPLFIASQ